MKFIRPATTFLISAALGLSGCTAYGASSKSSCRVCKLPVKVGMARSEVETMVATALGKQSDYSPYVNNLVGGTVSYADGGWALVVTYLQGTPAPWVINAQGVGEHYPPQEEKVEQFKVRKLSR